MDSSPLATLPLELIFRILDFLEPHKYSGFSCTCRHAVTIVNRKLDNAADQEELWSGMDLNDSQALYSQLSSWKSRTARYVHKERKRSQLMLAQYRTEMEEEESGCHYGPDDEDGIDL